MACSPDRALTDDKRLFLKRVGIGCLGMVVGALVGGVVGAGIGQANEPPASGGYLEGTGVVAVTFVGMLVGAWAGLVVVALVGSVRDWRAARRRQGHLTDTWGRGGENG
jgi:hypothetical protein